MVKRPAPSLDSDPDSDSDSDSFQEVIIQPIASTSTSKSKSSKLPPPIAPPVADHSDDEEGAWDEVDVNQDNRASAIAAVASAALGDGLEIVIRGNGLNGKGKGKEKGKQKRKPTISTAEERMIRQQTHKTHVMALLAAGLVRNRFLNDDLLKARLLSKCPLRIQNSFTAFDRTTHPNERDRSRLFDLALRDLIHWWYQEFEIIDGIEIKRRLPKEVEDELISLGLIEPRPELPSEDQDTPSSKKKGKEVPKSNGRMDTNGKGKGKGTSVDFNLATEGQGEQVNSINSLMKCALKMRGSKDMSAQLFTCLCRAMDIPARLIFSLQPFDWRPPSALQRYSGKRKATNEDESEDDVEAGRSSASKRRKNANVGSSRIESENELSDDGDPKFDYVVPAPNLRRTRIVKKPVSNQPAPDTVDRDAPPVFWTEVWTRSNRQWITVDVSRQAMRCKKAMEPAKGNIENQMMYVCAYEEDNSVRDVTPRYAKTYNLSTIKARVPSKKGADDWFSTLLTPLARTFLLNRDRDELAELWSQKPNEPMPTSTAGFKDHPLYFLEQHLKRDEAILPGTRQLGLFRATEAVYPRSSVVSVKSAENYYRFGIVVKEGEEPMKLAKKRTVTISKKRAEAAALYDGLEVERDALYAESQTELYVPDPIVDGKILKNNFGNIDLFVPSMLPAGAVHLPNKGAAKCAKSLGIDYADAITGFEFRQRRATPTITGIVVAEEFAELLIEAIANTEEATLEKESEKLREKCIKSWKKLILGLRIRQRLQAAYVSKTTLPQNGQSQFSPAAIASTSKSLVKAEPKSPTLQATVVKSVVKPIAKAVTKPVVKSVAKNPMKTTIKPTARSSAPPTRSSTKIQVEAKAVPPPPPLNRSASGRTLRFTVSEDQIGTPEVKVDKKGKGKEIIILSDSDEEEEEEVEVEVEVKQEEDKEEEVVELGGFELEDRGHEDGDSDSSLEYESD